MRLRSFEFASLRASADLPSLPDSDARRRRSHAARLNGRAPLVDLYHATTRRSLGWQSAAVSVADFLRAVREPQRLTPGMIRKLGKHPDRQIATLILDGLV